MQGIEGCGRTLTQRDLGTDKTSAVYEFTSLQSNKMIGWTCFYSAEYQRSSLL